MALPPGLVPVLVFALTVGTAVPVALGARVRHRRGEPFPAALGDSVRTVAALYLLGVAVVWILAGGVSLWELAAALVAVGLVALVLLVVAPLWIGRSLVGRLRALDDQAALRVATNGWVVAMGLAFAIFVAPGGLSRGHLLSLSGPTVCFVGFCGISVALLLAVALELLVAFLGPALFGIAIHDALTARRDESDR